MDIREEVKKLKANAPIFAASGVEKRNSALNAVIESLQANREEIFSANAKDLKRAEESGISPSVIKRMKFDSSKLKDSLNGLRTLIELPDPLSEITLARELDKDLLLYRVTCPIGVIGVIFEARPDAMIQISGLCIKSGNCAVLKGGKETAETTDVIFRLISEGLASAGFFKCLVHARSHSEIDEILSMDESIDLIIPRGSNSFVRYIMDHTKIPVMGHADGICHVYVDKDADLEKSVPVIADAKIQYAAACNAAETLLIHRGIPKDFIIKLSAALKEKGVKLRGTKEISDMIGCETMEENNFPEYLDLILSVKMVSDVDEAIEHINRFGSHHTDCILTENKETALKFMNLVDSAGVYQNCSTRFADGFRYGFGAEVGISTGKIHARGPVGLEGLVTYKYRLFGNGHTVGDYASGRKKFHFKDIT